MLSLSPAAAYAIQGMEVLAQEHGPAPVTLKEICSRSGASRDYLAKILGTLAKQDLVEAVRGKNGGYRLARPAKSLSLLEIIEAVEGPICLNLCQHDPPRCQRENCPVRAVWAEIQHFMRQKLGCVTLAQCAAPEAPEPADAVS